MNAIQELKNGAIGTVILATFFSMSIGALAAPLVATAELKDAKGVIVGEATLTELEGGVKVAVSVHGLTAGEHGVHFHELGKCQGPDFKSAGSHYNPEGKEHGFENPKGAHSGDLPNLIVGANGKGSMEYLSTRLTLKGKDALIKTGGTSLVLHAKKDDEKSNPSGESGDRVACGVVKIK